MNFTDMLGVLLAFISLIVAILALKSAEKALKATNHSLLLSICLHKRTDLINSLTYFYYPLNEYLLIQITSQRISSKESEVVDLEKELMRVFNEHMYLDDSNIKGDLPKLISYTETDLRDLKLRVKSIMTNKEKEIDQLTKRIKELNGE
ncbi:hypothetical protein [Methanosarcina vacuolata]|uniref:hypothetical protein n=1 Tax=Methanosarcina vacuolata TaxID=2215 RepID=UPI00064FBFF7|nr:hypothetical protein [Methanosarcina vacuolata]